MKRAMKLFSIALVFVLSISLLSGCSNKNEQTPASAAQMYVNVLSQKQGALDTINNYIGDDLDINDIFNIETIKENAFKGLNVGAISEESTNELINALFNSLQKAEVKIEDLKNNVVKVSVRAIDFQQLTRDATRKVTQNILEHNTPKKAAEALYSYMMEGLENPPLKDKFTSFEAQFVNENGTWSPQNPNSFSRDLVRSFIEF